MNQTPSRSEQLREALRKDLTAVEGAVCEHDGLPAATKVLRLAPGHDLYLRWQDAATRLRDHEAKMNQGQPQGQRTS